MTKLRKPYTTGRAALLATAMALGTVLAVSPASSATPETSAAATGTTSPSVRTSVNDDLTPVLPTPWSDPFYTPPAGWESKAPGTVLRSRPVKVSSYLVPIPEKIYQLLYRTTDSKDRPVTSVTTVFVPLQVATGLVKNPNVFSFQIAEDSLGLKCAPSVELKRGVEKEATGVFTALSMGWVAVIPDFEGPRGAWIAGPMSGHAVLDSIRAARNFAPARVTTTSKIAGYGYSGGGVSTAWAAELQGSYAPDLRSQVVGWVAGDFPADVSSLFYGHQSLITDGGALGGFFFGALTGVSREYPELMQFFTPAGRAKMEQIKDLCQIPLAISALFGKVGPLMTVPLEDLKDEPVAAAVFDANTIGHQAPVAPVMLQAGLLDELMPIEQVESANSKWCALGANVQLRYSVVPEHIVNLLATIPGALQWIIARYAGLPSPSTC